MSLDNITTAFVNTYGKNVMLMAQQQGSYLRSLVREEAVSGERHYFELYNTTSAMKGVTSRGGKIDASDTAFERRAVDLSDYYDAKQIYDFDKVRMLADPTSPIVMEQANLVGKQIDQIIIDALDASMKTGKDGATLVAAQSAIAVNSWAYGVGSGNANLTMSKVLEAKTLMDKAYVPADNRILLADSTNYNKLLATVEATSRDFSVGDSLQTGVVNNLAGFKVVRHPLLDLSANRDSGSGNALAYAFHGGPNGGMGLATGINPTYRIDRLVDVVGQPYQAYVHMSMAATRLENSKVVPILCLTT